MLSLEDITYSRRTYTTRQANLDELEKIAFKISMAQGIPAHLAYDKAILFVAHREKLKELSLSPASLA